MRPSDDDAEADAVAEAGADSENDDKPFALFDWWMPLSASLICRTKSADKSDDDDDDEDDADANEEEGNDTSAGEAGTTRPPCRWCWCGAPTMVL